MTTTQATRTAHLQAAIDSSMARICDIIHRGVAFGEKDGSALDGDAYLYHYLKLAVRQHVQAFRY